MKKHLLAIAALAAVSGTVAAQNVTVYGVIDNAIQTESKTSAAHWMPELTTHPPPPAALPPPSATKSMTAC